MATNMSVAPKPQMSVAVKPKTPAPNMGGLLGKLGSVFSSAPKTTLAPSLSTGFGRPVAPTQSIPAPKPPASLETLRAKNQATRAAAPVNPAVMDVGKPIAPKTPPPAAQQQAVAGFQTQENQATEAPETLKAPARSSFTDDTSYSSALAKFQATGNWGNPAPGWDQTTYNNFKTANPSLEPDAEDTARMNGTWVDPAKAQLESLRKSYASTFELSPEEQAAAGELSSISSQGASEVAKKKQEYADRVKAIQEQATLQPFLTGRQVQASGQLADQLAAIQSGTEAQTMPLREKVALLQAQRMAQQKRAEAEIGFAKSDREAEQVTPVEVDGRLVNPRTGQVVYESPAKAGDAKTFTLSPGQRVYGADGQIIAENPEGAGSDKFTNVSPGSTVIDSMGNVVFRAPSADEIAGGGSTSAAAVETLNGKLQMIDDLMTSPGMRGSVGPYGIARWTPFSADASARQDFAAGVQQLIAKDTMDVLLNLKKQGGTLGALSDQERILLQSAASKIGTWMDRDKNGNPTGKFKISEDLFKKELQTIRDLTSSALQRAGESGGAGVQNGVITDPNAFLNSF